MASAVWVRRKTNICEVCNRIMGLGEAYKGRCENCNADFCNSCRGTGEVCKACANPSLFQTGQSLVVG